MCVQGMVLDLDAGRWDALPSPPIARACAFLTFVAHSLTVWLNGKRRGVMVPSGLVGPLRWAVDVWDRLVRVDGPKPMIAAD